MLKKKIYLLLLVFFGANFFATEPPLFFSNSYTKTKRAKSPRIRTRFTAGPLISMYSINEHHARKPHQKASGVISLKEEIRMNNAHNVHFLFGVEYLVQGMNFNSYYFAPGELQLYNDDMGFNYSLYINEIDVPLQVKLSLKHENNALFTPYFMFGYHLRTILNANLKVSENGNEVLSKAEDITFKNPTVTNKHNPFLSITYGIQKNNPDNTRTAFFAEITYRQGLSPYLLSDTFTPSSLYINGNHFSFSLGVKF